MDQMKCNTFQNPNQVIADPMEHGNFKNYYTFHNAVERVKCLPSNHSIWSPDIEFSNDPYLVLDVGCNVGDLTQMLWQFLKTIMPDRDVFVLGIDMDETLIDRAVANNHQPCITYAHFDVMTQMSPTYETPTHINEFLLKYGEREQFDAVCCFSITMWIHLKYGDIGLKHFLTTMSRMSQLLVIEPQPWKCYQTAKRRLKRTGKEFPRFNKLQWRLLVEKHICDYLEKSDRRKVYECEPTAWGRRVCFYR